MDLPTSWPHFEEMHSYCASRHSINPVLIINSESSQSPEPPLQSPEPPLQSPEPPLQSTSFELVSSDSVGSHQSGPSSSKRQVKRKLDEELRKSELKTQKEMRKASRAFVAFISNNFGITVESSDSD